MFPEAISFLPVANGFIILAGEKGLGRTTKKPLHFKDTIFHRIIPGFMAQVILTQSSLFKEILNHLHFLSIAPALALAHQ